MAREQDVRSVIEGIGDAFSQLDIDRWLSFFNPQHTFVHDDFVFVAHSLDETKNAFDPMINSLREAGFRRSDLDLCNIKFLGPKMAVASTLWTRFGDNDEVLEKFGSTYTLLDTSEGWKVVVAAGHDYDVVLVK
ncbi:MAG: nuclear transport factor 2 family protein [Pirellulales bacterium]|nr:nuclear transport factor 2 family protein [Pirellulales bacterium]